MRRTPCLVTLSEAQVVLVRALVGMAGSTRAEVLRYIVTSWLSDHLGVISASAKLIDTVDRHHKVK